MNSAHLYLLLAIVAEVIGTSALKSVDGFTNPLPSVTVALGYGVAFYFLSLVLKTIPLGVAYAVRAGLGMVLVILVGLFAFNQVPDAAAVIGMGLIVAGVVIINVFSTTATL